MKDPDSLALVISVLLIRRTFVPTPPARHSFCACWRRQRCYPPYKPLVYNSTSQISDVSSAITSRFAISAITGPLIGVNLGQLRFRAVFLVTVSSCLTLLLDHQSPPTGTTSRGDTGLKRSVN